MCLRVAVAPLVVLLARVRTVLARHGWVYWATVAALAVPLAGAVADRLDDLDRARRGWGERRTVWVSTAEHLPGDPLATTAVDLPAVAVPDAAVAARPSGSAAQRIGRGEIVTDADVGGGRFAAVPPGWRAVAFDRRPPSPPVERGDRVSIVDVAGVIADEAVVVHVADDIVLVAVPAERSVQAAIAAREATATLILRRSDEPTSRPDIGNPG